jgi:nucleotide-binding universal stress UspA family protein
MFTGKRGETVMKVLLGCDGSAVSEAAIRWVTRATWPPGTRFLALTAIPPFLIGPGEATNPILLEEATRLEEQRQKEVANRAVEELRRAGLTAELRLSFADPRLALVETARSEQSDLIVVGSHGRTGIKKLLIGSVASHVVTHAPCSVLVVKSTS